MAPRACDRHAYDGYQKDCRACMHSALSDESLPTVDYGKVAAAAFQTDLDRERNSLRESLSRVYWRQLGMGVECCPVCGACVPNESIDRHVEWHVRCLQ